MRIAHIADTHLGYRAYNKVNEAGLNAREVDVFDAFRQALENVAEIDPQLVLIAGDMFHSVRPSNLAIQYAFRELIRLRMAIEAPVVIIAGNHDSPRSRDTGCVLDLLTNIEGVQVVHAEPKQLRFSELDTSVFCLPHAGLPFLSSLRIVPDPNSKYNILMAHARPEGKKRGFDQYEITRKDVRHEEWDYVAYGHLHSYEQLDMNAYHPGSLEYAGGLTVWEQLAACKEKGFIEYDLAERKMIGFHPVSVRDAVDIRAIDAAGLSAEELNGLIERRIAGVRGGIKNKIVRLVVENVDMAMRGQINYAALREARAEALHFDLELRKPALSERQGLDGQDHVARPLEQEWDDFIRDREMPGGIERERFRTLGRQYLVGASPLEAQ